MTTRAPGLTAAMRRALERVRDAGSFPSRISYATNDKARSEFVRNTTVTEFTQTGRKFELTPRGHAALAAPRMTQAELVALEWYANGQTGPLRPHGKTINRLYSQKWYRDGELTPSGLKALNNIRAAMGSELYKDNMP